MLIPEGLFFKKNFFRKTMINTVALFKKTHFSKKCDTMNEYPKQRNHTLALAKLLAERSSKLASLRFDLIYKSILFFVFGTKIVQL